MLKDYNIADLVTEDLKDLLTDCILTCSEAVLKMLTFRLVPIIGRRTKYRVVISDPVFQGKLNIFMGPGAGTIHIDSAGYINLEIRMWRNSTLKIGRGTTISFARIICDHSDVIIGEDGLWSDEILVQSNDQHGIVDVTSMDVVNSKRRSTTVKDHVWIGRRTILMPDVSVGAGSVLGTGAILTKDMPENVVFAGVPAKKVREGVSWSRSPDGLSEYERRNLISSELNRTGGNADE